MNKLIALLVLFAIHSCAWASPTTQPDDVIADFEGATYGDWVTTGDAFGIGPAHGALPRQMSVSGFLGKGLVNTYLNLDTSQGTLTSPEFQVHLHYINFLVGGGNHPDETCVNLLVDGKVVRTRTGSDDEHLDWATWDVSAYANKSARIEIVDRNSGGWGHILVDQIVQSDTRQEPEAVALPPYSETHRPQFHFTSTTGWLNDPNGLVFYKGEYHLFFQHNPKGNAWGNMTWGHAVSADLLHWKQLPDAIEPDKLGTIFSGSAVIDWNNTAGFATGGEKTLVAMYTAAGSPFTQCIAYSNDLGRTFVKYDKNPVLPNVKGENRDPRLVWDANSKKWILALFLDGNTYALYSSDDLKKFTHLQDIPMPGCGECPDFFPIGVVGEEHVTKWVLTAANGQYFVGDFDGATYKPDSQQPRRVEFGRNDYAVQTYSDIPATDGRRIQIAWMNGGVYPRMPFNQQMSIPCELTLHREKDGLHLWKYPVREVEALRGAPLEIPKTSLICAQTLAPELKGDLFDATAEIELPAGGVQVELRIFGQNLMIDTSGKKISGLGDAPLTTDGPVLKLRILVDRTSIEVFVNDGRVAISSCYLPAHGSKPLEIQCIGPTATIKSMTLYPMKSVWPQPPSGPTEK